MMKCTSIYASFMLLFLATVCHAEWISPTDKKYANENSALYAEVAKAKALISDAKGRTDLNHQAVDILRKVLEKDAKFAPAYVQFARVLSNLGYQVNNRFDGDSLRSQEDYLNKALALEPDYDYAIAMMAFTKMFQGNLDEAERLYKKAELLGSSYPFLKSQQAQLATRRGDYKKAIKLATQSYEENKSDSNVATGAINELIFAYERLDGNYNQELEAWQTKRRNLEPNVAWNWGDHARFRLYFLGDHEGAIKYSEKALALMNYGVARYILAAAHYKKWADLKGTKARSTEAQAAWEKAQKLYPDAREVAEEFIENPTLRASGNAILAKLGAGVTR